MSLEVWILFTGTVLAFMSTPGPSHILMLSNSISSGFKRSVATAAGDLSANLLQMLAASIGLATVLSESRYWFVWIKWAGVVYLAYLGLKLIWSSLNPHKSLLERPSRQPRSRSSLYWQGFITSAANPKAVVFFAALFPQFINQAEPLLGQFAVLSLTYLLIDGIFLCLYGKFADFFARKINSSSAFLLERSSGVLYLLAAGLLGTKDLGQKV